MSYEQHDMFRDRLRAVPLSAGRRGIAAMVLVEIVRWMPESGRQCTKTTEELAELLNLRTGEVLAALRTLAAVGVVQQVSEGATRHICLLPMKLEKTAGEMRKEVVNAIHWHSDWKRRLRHAIDTGETDVVVEDVGRDDLCALGQWLYGPSFSEADRDGAYDAVCHLHAQFHRIAAATLQLALSGRKEEAERAMSATGVYARASQRLTVALSGWRGSETP